MVTPFATGIELFSEVEDGCAQPLHVEALKRCIFSTRTANLVCTAHKYAISGKAWNDGYLRSVDTPV
jgi:hypothetical protein